MSHQPISLIKVSATLAHKPLFVEATASITHGHRIAIIGKNGCGKSTMLAMLADEVPVSAGLIVRPHDVTIGHVKQLQDEHGLSGSEQFHKQLHLALALNPNVLLLDEPTNHLDQKNRASLMRILNKFPHTLIVATHDETVLRQRFDAIWHLQDGRLTVFSGCYDDFVIHVEQRRASITHDLALLQKEGRKNHEALMHEQTRAKKSRQMGEKSIANRKWPTIVASSKARRAEQTSGKKRAALNQEREALLQQRKFLRVPEIITPKFHLTPAAARGPVVSIKNGSVGYEQPILSAINLYAQAADRIVIAGTNGVGKSTLMKALRGDHAVKREGEWRTPALDEIGFLDQNYRTLNNQQSVFANLAEVRPDWTIAMVRCHLNDFLFRKNEEVHARTSTLSGGERARLSLCLIAARTPKLLLLDEITNNIDKETREHLIQVLSAYGGCMVIISHDQAFVDNLAITNTFTIENAMLTQAFSTDVPCRQS